MAEIARTYVAVDPEGAYYQKYEVTYDPVSGLPTGRHFDSPG